MISYPPHPGRVSLMSCTPPYFSPSVWRDNIKLLHCAVPDWSLLIKQKKIYFPSGAKLLLNIIVDLSTFSATNLLWMQECSCWPKTFCSTGTQRTPTEKWNRKDKIHHITLKKELWRSVPGSQIFVLEKHSVRNNVFTATETYISHIYQASESYSCCSNAAVSALVMCAFNGTELFSSATLPRPLYIIVYVITYSVSE